MKQYIDKIIEGFPEIVDKTAMIPAADYLFKIRDEGETKKLDEERSIAVHHATTQLLFLSGRVRRDIQTAAAFLTT